MSIGYRRQRRRVETAIHHLHRPGRTITVVATVPYAEQAYYDDLAARIRERENQGFAVHYAFCDTSVPAGATPTAAELQALLRWRACDEHKPVTFEVLGLDWVPQAQAMPPGPHWVNCDASALELIRLAGPAAVTRLLPPPHIAQEQVERLRTAAPARAAERRALERSHRRTPAVRERTSARMARAAGLAELHDPIISAHRAVLAVHSVLAAERDVVLVWSAEAVPRIVAVLGRNDFTLRPEMTEWHVPISWDAP